MPIESKPDINEAILMAGVSDMHNCAACGDLCSCGKGVDEDCVLCEECQEWYFKHGWSVEGD